MNGFMLFKDRCMVKLLVSYIFGLNDFFELETLFASLF